MANVGMHASLKFFARQRNADYSGPCGFPPDLKCPVSFLRNSCAWNEKLLHCPALRARDHCSRSKLRTPCVRSLQMPYITCRGTLWLRNWFCTSAHSRVPTTVRTFRVRTFHRIACRPMEHATMLPPIVARGQQCPKHDIA